MNSKAFRLLALVAAVFVSAAAPCLAAIPDARAACARGGCPTPAAGSIDTVRPCCCDGAGRGAVVTSFPSQLPVAVALATAGLRSHIPPVAGRPGAASITALQPAEPVPLYLLHSSLLI